MHITLNLSSEKLRAVLSLVARELSAKFQTLVL